MDSQLLERFVRLLATQTGIVTRIPERSTLVKILHERRRALSLDTLERYYAMLAPQRPDGALTIAQTKEWQALAIEITTGESYFFRDRGQFNLLETELLPAAIAARRREQAELGAARPTLKIWSAGCSTGEELYSLTILLTRLLPDWERWDLQLVGTDINVEFLRAARQGCYTNWSFRQVPAGVRERHFQAVSGGRRWQIDPKFRQLVQFRYGNLLADSFAGPAFQDCDLIVCRNVFIYFSTPAIACVLEKFKTRLRSGGYLLCGHTELRDCDTSGLTTHLFPASLVYQRPGEGIATTPTIVPPVPATVPPLSTTELSGMLAFDRSLYLAPPFPMPVATAAIAIAPPPAISAVPLKEIAKPAQDAAPTTTLERAEALLQAGDAEAALAVAEQLPPTYATLLTLARARADRGYLERAEAAARQASECDPEAIAPLEVLAHIAEERGDLALAKRYWRQVIYLDPEAIVAYLELAAILQREGNVTAAQKQQSAARELLAALPPTEPVDCGCGRPERLAAQLLRQLG